MKILDATCGSKEIWFQKNHPFVTFMDKRKGYFFYQYPNSPKKEEYHIEPDVVSEWKDAPFPDNIFDMVIFDPPHIIRNGEKGILPTKYTVLKPDTWRQELQIGIKKLFDVLKPNGFFVLKWDECNIKKEEIFKLIPYPPLFGTRTGSDNYWIVFLKYRMEKELDIR